jgi:ABC-type phosphate transport system substrate-binding protein
MAVMAAMLPVLVLTWSASPAAAADAAAEKAEASAVKVIVNSDVADESLKSDFIMNVFLGKITKWPEGKKIIPVVLGKGDTAREFLRNYVKKTPQQFSTFWKKQVFTGKGTPPKEFDTDSELIEFVQKTSGAVGFVAASTEPENVKVVKID